MNTTCPWRHPHGSRQVTWIIAGICPECGSELLTPACEAHASLLAAGAARPQCTTCRRDCYQTAGITVRRDREFGFT